MICLLKAFPNWRCETSTTQSLKLRFRPLSVTWQPRQRLLLGSRSGAAVQIEPQGMGRAVKHMAGKAVLICPCCLDAFPLRVGRTGTEQEQCAQTRILGMLRLLEDAESVDYTTLAITTLFLGGALSVSSNPARGEGFWAACKNHTHSA